MWAITVLIVRLKGIEFDPRFCRGVFARFIPMLSNPLPGDRAYGVIAR